MGIVCPRRPSPSGPDRGVPQVQLFRDHPVQPRSSIFILLSSRLLRPEMSDSPVVSPRQFDLHGCSIHRDLEAECSNSMLPLDLSVVITTNCHAHVAGKYRDGVIAGSVKEPQGHRPHRPGGVVAPGSTPASPPPALHLFRHGRTPATASLICMGGNSTIGILKRARVITTTPRASWPGPR